MNDMVDRVAEALYNCSGYARLVEGAWHHDREDVREIFLRAARVAIEAMREPTPGMIFAGRQAPPALELPTGERLGSSDCDVNALAFDPHHPSNTTTRRYVAMIDAALDEPRDG